MMTKLTFSGSSSERELYVDPSKAAMIEAALEMIGYRVHQGGTVNPWREAQATRHSMVAALGKYNDESPDSLFFLADDEETALAAWEAIRLCYPQASHNVREVKRPA